MTVDEFVKALVSATPSDVRLTTETTTDRLTVRAFPIKKDSSSALIGEYSTAIADLEKADRRTVATAKQALISRAKSK